MARYILLRVDDNEEAGLLLKLIQKWKGIMLTHVNEDEGSEEDYKDTFVNTTVRGLWAVPVNFCDCETGARSWTRGRKYGWWVCTKCKKPGKLWAEGHDWYRSLGTNLLPISDDAPDWRGPGHKQHEGYTEDVKKTAAVEEWLRKQR
jgi:hypothetical protein